MKPLLLFTEVSQIDLEVLVEMLDILREKRAPEIFMIEFQLP